MNQSRSPMTGDSVRSEKLRVSTGWASSGNGSSGWSSEGSRASRDEQQTITLPILCYTQKA